MRVDARSGVLHGAGPDGRGLRLHLADGLVAAVDHDVTPGSDGLLVPGFVDLQVNGVADVDVNADEPAWERAAALLARTGTTAWLPTLVSQPLSVMAARLDAVGRAMTAAPAGAVVLGAHLEGPFLGGRPGAHRVRHIVDIDLAWLRGLPDHVRLVTLGPEQPAAREAIALLADRGIVASLGHSAADAACAAAAVDAGARFATHLFNAMPPLHHRAPGLVGVALADDRVTVGVIADGVHVDPMLLRVIVRAKTPARVAVVTDSVAAETDALRGVGVRVVDGAPRLPDGTIAGSVLTMDQALRNLVDAGVPPPDAVTTLSTTPAEVLGDTGRGRLVPGARADVVVLDPDALTVRHTFVAGEPVAGA